MIVAERMGAIKKELERLEADSDNLDTKFLTVPNWLRRYNGRGFDGLRDLSRSSRSMQTRLERLTAEKCRTVSAGLMRRCDS